MKSDISSKTDIEKVVNLFYDKIKKDELIGFFFSKVIVVDWAKHLPKMSDFWENVLFYTGEYESSPLEVHRQLHLKHPTNAAHFDRWLQLFDETVDALFAGEHASRMKQQSRDIAEVMIQKIASS